MHNQVVVLIAFLGFCGSPTRALPQDTDWSKVGKLSSGDAIAVRLEGLPEISGFLVSVTDSGITFLNLNDTMVPDAAARQLRMVAIQRPEYFDAATNGNTIVFNHLRLARDDVFYGDRPVARLSRLVEMADRTNVAEIKVRRRGRGFWGHLGPLGGYFVGAFAAGIAGGLVCQAFNGRDRCDTGAFLAGGLVGGIAGATYGAVAAHRESIDVLYRAPHAPAAEMSDRFEISDSSELSTRILCTSGASSRSLVTSADRPVLSAQQVVR